jgi:uncharacterized protein YdhG (YjbR/CyaY superfamily)
VKIKYHPGTLAQALGAMVGCMGKLNERPCGILAPMKKADSKDRDSTTKGKTAPKNIDEYLAGVPEPARTTLSKMRAVIRSVVPAEATECISYGIGGFKYKGPLVWFAAFAKHCSFFPGNSTLIKTFAKELMGYQTSKGTIRFPVDQPLPPALLKKIVKIRVAENERKKKR